MIMLMGLHRACVCVCISLYKLGNLECINTWRLDVVFPSLCRWLLLYFVRLFFCIVVGTRSFSSTCPAKFSFIFSALIDTITNILTFGRCSINSSLRCRRIDLPADQRDRRAAGHGVGPEPGRESRARLIFRRLVAFIGGKICNASSRPHVIRHDQSSIYTTSLLYVIIIIIKRVVHRFSFIYFITRKHFVSVFLFCVLHSFRVCADCRLFKFIFGRLHGPLLDDSIGRRNFDTRHYIDRVSKSLDQIRKKHTQEVASLWDMCSRRE